MKTRLVKDWMTEKVLTISPITSLREAQEIMQANSIRHLPVVKKGKLVGIITNGDIRETSHELDKKTQAIMNRNVIAVSADDTLKAAVEMMYNNKIGALPVVDNRDHVVGIITEVDIFKVLIALFNEEENP